MEDNDAAIIRNLLKDASTRYLADWRKTRRQSNATFQELWHKIRKLRKGPLSHRAYMSPSDFAKGLRQYLERVEQAGGPSVLIDQQNWRNTWDNLRGIRWFGDLAKFDYLSLICLLSLCECPDAIPHTGKGPIKGLRMVYGENATLEKQGSHLLQLVLQRTDDPRVVFALEDILCLMHYSGISSEFCAYFKNHDLRTLLRKYLEEYGNGRRCDGRPRLPCYSRTK
jgi:hypothetical protein